jgi:N-acetylglutamate synthase-like GNAT family acetyltransferase
MWEEDRAALLAHPDAIDLPAEQISGGRIVVIELAGKVVGFAAVLPREDGNVDLDGLFVEPANWRTGLGTLLIKEVARRAAGEGANFVYVLGNPRAKDFYASCGFEVLGEAPTRFGTGLTMRRTV